MSDSARIKELRKEIESLCSNCDRPDKELLGKIVLSSMVFGFSVGLEASSADRPQGEWIHSHEGTIAEGLYCSNCGKYGFGEEFCPNCKVRMKGTDDEN